MDITTKKRLVWSNIAILVIPILEAAVLANKQRRMQQTGDAPSLRPFPPCGS